MASKLWYTDAMNNITAEHTFILVYSWLLLEENIRQMIRIIELFFAPKWIGGFS